MEHSFQQSSPELAVTRVQICNEYEMEIHTQTLWWACTEKAQGPISRVTRFMSVVD